MTLRLACASTFAALGLACSSTVFARVVVYRPVPVIYAPPRPAYDSVPFSPVSVPPLAAMHVVLPLADAVPAVPAVPVRPLPMYTNVVVPAPTNYAAWPTPAVSYAQPLADVPRQPAADTLGSAPRMPTVASA